MTRWVEERLGSILSYLTLFKENNMKRSKIIKASQLNIQLYSQLGDQLSNQLRNKTIEELRKRK
jgi:hypothetical protein